MRVCGIVGSPKKNGNTDLLVSQVLDGARSAGAETEKIYLNDLSIKACQSCGEDPSPRFCLFSDDMKIIYAALDSCDVIVLGSPVYFDTVSAQTKLMIDRCNCLMPYVERPNGSSGFAKRMRRKKKGVFIAIAGIGQEFNAILTTVKGFFNWANIELAETIFFTHDDSKLGGVKSRKEKMDQAYDVGVGLARTLPGEK